jgi:hypothetical protein
MKEYEPIQYRWWFAILVIVILVLFGLASIVEVP